MIATVIVFLVLLSVLVLIHEFGHLIVGKLAGMGVEEFALGLPFTKPIFSKTLKDGMKISLYPLLFGGFVKLLGEEGLAENTQKVKGEYFYKSNVWARIAVVVAGIVMNLVLAIVAFYLFLSLVNFKVLVPKLAEYKFLSPSQNLVSVNFVAKGSPAEIAKLNPGDVFLTVDDRIFDKLPDFQAYIKTRAGKPVLLKVSDLSLEKEREVLIMPRVNPPPGEGALGIGIGEAVMLSYQGDSRRASGLVYSADMLGYNVAVIGSFITKAYKTGDVEPLKESVSGPVGIASAVGMILDLGGRQAILQLINLLGLLSLSLAFMNILPIPALDGGRLAFLLIEALTGKKVPQKWENRVNQIGMVAMLGLIVLISFNDVAKILAPMIRK
jgi:regulator of sigma E protease